MCIYISYHASTLVTFYQPLSVAFLMHLSRTLTKAAAELEFPSTSSGAKSLLARLFNTIGSPAHPLPE